MIWEQDASYTYYAHGPLRRTVLGRDLVQGLDYTYTIAGWLKGINLPTLSTSEDPGKDGLATGSNPTVGRDAFGMQLHYHNGDFAGGPTAFTGTRSEASFKGLYNGNIAGWSYTSRSENGTPQTTMLSTYSYDKLNRLKQDQPYTMVNNASTVTSKWSSSYSYDLDVNITNLERKDGSGSGIDNLSYVYPASGGKTINNRLNHIVDHTTGNGGGAGVVTQNPDNYSYDATGNLTSDVTEGITSITWTPYNKIRELVKTNAAPATGTTTLRYLYDAAGNRVVKDYHATQNTTLTSRTWTIRDAQGTVLAIYTRKPTAGNSGSVTRTEAPIYGSSRIGQSTRTATYDATASGEATLLGTVYSRELGKRAYELVDHLGNVRATISDILVPRTATNTYDADILTLTDYYPFGMQMDTRTWEAGGSSDYRYGYNTQERSDEIAGEGNHYTAEFWEYDPRAARRWNLDPRPVAGLSDYSTFQNNPIRHADPLGDSIRVEVTSGFLFWRSTETYTYRDGSWYDSKNGLSDPNEVGGLLEVVNNAFNAEGKAMIGTSTLLQLADSKFDFTIKWGDRSAFKPDGSGNVANGQASKNLAEFPELYEDLPTGSGGVITLNRSPELLPEEDGKWRARVGVILFHEMFHALLAMQGNTIDGKSEYPTPYGPRGFANEEIIVSLMENRLRLQMGYPQRTHYGVVGDRKGTFGPSVRLQDQKTPFSVP